MTKEIPIPVETMDREMQTDETCFDDNGYLPIVGKPQPEPEPHSDKPSVSIPGLEGAGESYITETANEQPPNYDEETLEVYPDEGGQTQPREREIDFTKDRSAAAREEIATRCGAEKIFVPNRWGTKTSILNLYVTGIVQKLYTCIY